MFKRGGTIRIKTGQRVGAERQPNVRECHPWRLEGTMTSPPLGNPGHDNGTDSTDISSFRNSENYRRVYTNRRSALGYDRPRARTVLPARCAQGAEWSF